MPEGAFFDAAGLASWTVFGISASSIVNCEDDPEDTLMVQLATSEVGIATLGALLVGRLFPETRPKATCLMTKLNELATVQEFFQPPGTENQSE